MSILSKRLTAVAQMVTSGLVVADIGCDHAYLPIYLIKNNIAPKVIACDVNKGPIEIARGNVNEYGYSEAIDVRLGNGLAPVKENEAECVVIAGMGGKLITEILSAGSLVLKNVQEIILEPQSEVPYVRHFLEDNGYEIVAENMVLDEGKYYPIIKAIKGDMHISDDMYYRYSKQLIDDKHPVLREYLKKQQTLYNNLIIRIKDNGESEDTNKRLQELSEELMFCSKALELME